MARDTILISGIRGNLGRTIARLLHRSEKVAGLDRRPFVGKPKDVELHQLDLRKKKVEDVFRKGEIKALLHMAIMHDPRLPQSEHHSFNVVGTKGVLEFAAKYGVQKVVVLSSTNVYGPRPDNDNFLTEDAPPLGSQTFPDIRDPMQLDHNGQQK